MLRMKIQRAATGKDSVFRVRGKTVTIDDVLRYFKRKGILNPEVEAQTFEASMSAAIDCLTPPPTPKPGSATVIEPGEQEVDLYEPLGTEIGGISCMALDTTYTQGNEVNAYLNMDQTRQVIFSNPEIQSFEVPDSPLPPRSLLIPEKLFASIASYFEGIFDSVPLTEKDNRFLGSANEPGEIQNLHSFRDLCFSGINLMNSKSFAEGRCFSKASGLIRHLLQEKDPRALEFFFFVLIVLNSRGYGRVARSFRALACGMAKYILAKEYPIRHIFYYISNLEDFHFEPGLIQAWRCLSDMFISLLGQFDTTVLGCYTTYINARDVLNGPHLLRCLLVRREQLDKFDNRLFNNKYSIGYALWNQRQYTEAIEVVEGILAYLRSFEAEDLLVVGVFELLSLCQYSLGHQKDAESKLREAIKMTVKLYGKKNSLVLSLKTRLEIWLRK